MESLGVGAFFLAAAPEVNPHGLQGCSHDSSISRSSPAASSSSGFCCRASHCLSSRHVRRGRRLHIAPFKPTISARPCHSHLPDDKGSVSRYKLSQRRNFLVVCEATQTESVAVEVAPLPRVVQPPLKEHVGDPLLPQDKGIDFLDTSVARPAGKPGAPVLTKPSILTLMRHGESMWNDLKLFTGDVDIPLTYKGALEAMAGGRAIAATDFDIIFTSRLVRSKMTALLAMTMSVHKKVPVIIRGGYQGNGKTGDGNRLRLRDAAQQALEQAECNMVPVYADPALNERCYGDLQGLNKHAAARVFGKEQVDQWRRSHTTCPPNGESLMDTARRSVAFYQETIEPRLAEGQNVLVVAHGNVLRCIIAHLAGLTTMEMLRLEVVTAQPYTFSFDGESYAECCNVPPGEAVEEAVPQPSSIPLGIASVMTKRPENCEVDSLI